MSKFICQLDFKSAQQQLQNGIFRDIIAIVIMADKISVLIVNNRGKSYEYVAESILAALDSYIEDNLGFEKRFSASQFFWNKIKASVTVPDDVIRLANSFIKRSTYRVSRVVTNYTNCYPITVSLPSGDGYTLYSNNKKQTGTLTAHHGDSLTFDIIADKGYTISKASAYDKYTGNQLSYVYTNVPPSLTIQNITEQAEESLLLCEKQYIKF
jgi:hypothetical protein